MGTVVTGFPVTSSRHLALTHQLPGRSRFRLGVLYRNESLQRVLETELHAVDGIISVRANPLTGSLLVRYRAEKLAVRGLARLVSEVLIAADKSRPAERQRDTRIDNRDNDASGVRGTHREDNWLGQFFATGARAGLVGYRLFRDQLFHASASGNVPHVAAMASPLPSAGLTRPEAASGEKATAECVSCRPPTEWSLLDWVKRHGTFVPLTGMMAYQLIQEYYFKREISQSPLSLTGIVSMIAAVPLLKDAWRETVEEKRFTIHQFLAFSLVLGIFMGEALAAFEIIYILRAGMLLEDYVANRSRRAIRQMLEVSVKDAHLVEGGKEIDKPVEQVRRGDLLVVRTGEKIPVDGEIENGEALLNESSITGRSEAVFKEAGAEVFAGSYVDKGVLYLRALKVGTETYLARIAALVEASLDKKSPLQKRADDLAARLLKLGTISTLATFALTRSVPRAFSVMIVMSCPCATILAASTAVSAALHNAARRQILVKGGVYLEKVGEADVYCFDKTGTITTEEPLVATVVSRDERDLLHWAASAELHNSHALARAIIRHAEEFGVKPESHSISEHILGNGVKASVGEHNVMLGNRRMMINEAIDLTKYEQDARRLVTEGETVVYVVRDERLLGVIGIKNRIRPGARDVIQQLRDRGVKCIYLITGDERPVAEGLSRELGLDGCYAEVLPEEKARILNNLRDGDNTVVMVGDGVNDALALSDAEIGIAMGAGGSEVAIEVADIALADSDMRNLVYVRDLSQATLRVAEQNYYLAVGTNMAGVLLGAAGRLTPAMGGMIHIAHTLGIMLNSSRLIRARPGH